MKHDDMMQSDLGAAIAGRLSYQLFRTAHALGRHFHQTLGAEGMNRTQGAVMGHLYHYHDAGMTASDLSRCVGVTAASMSALLAQMERDGLIARTPHPDDARSQLIHLTGQGVAQMQTFPAKLETIDAKAFEGFSAEERELFKAMLQRVRANLEVDEPSVEDEMRMLIKEKQNIG